MVQFTMDFYLKAVLNLYSVCEAIKMVSCITDNGKTTHGMDGEYIKTKLQDIYMRESGDRIGKMVSEDKVHLHGCIKVIMLLIRKRDLGL